MLLNVVSFLLDENSERNSKRLLGNRVRKDIFPFGEGVSYSGSFKQIPGHNEFEVYTHFSGQDICKLCIEMSKRCDVQIELELPKQASKGQIIWERVDIEVSKAVRWRINQGE